MENLVHNTPTATTQAINKCGCLCQGIVRGFRGGKGEVGGGRKDTKEKFACERVCMKDCLVQSTKDIQPTIHHMACDPKANKTAMCCPAAISF